MLEPWPVRRPRSAPTSSARRRSRPPRSSAPSASRSSSPTRARGASPLPTPRPTRCGRAPIDVYVHAPYLINVCSPKPNVRYGSRKILQQTCDAAAEIDAAAVIVHGGHAEDDIAEGVGRWLRSLELLETDVTVLVENTAGGENAVARRFDALARLWEAIGDRRPRDRPRLLLRHLPRPRRRRGARRRGRARGRDHGRPRPAARQRLARPGRDRRRPPRAPRRGQDRPRGPAGDDQRRPRRGARGRGRDPRPARRAARPTSSSSRALG